MYDMRILRTHGADTQKTEQKERNWRRFLNEQLTSDDDDDVDRGGGNNSGINMNCHLARRVYLLTERGLGTVSRDSLTQ
ncbi:hypothetical protein Cob_v004418 [Colletotrichum orbiculare MAFF 240422]|uniref:Uncharacterized protein n=1 Tax=Colletotrichum orbiculare (strain 104-T / ATCC 96160 / CBS 514.97 / LARS 414 / MAFF 240422) TaxID=1213857 RepID=A0A484FYB0_COLOR|nr:hypothetical protein Cob_v004418 [Colletotrichum orbiculare MAFF 240422]